MHMTLRFLDEESKPVSIIDKSINGGTLNVRAQVCVRAPGRSFLK